jgi:hypothetical protein
LSRRPSTTKRLERRAEREARGPGNAPPRAPRQRTRRDASPGGSSINWTAILVGVGALAIVAFLVYAVLASNSSPAEPDWLKAQSNDSTSLPGQYFAPHPGPDGQVGTGDDREHFAPGIVTPICTQAQMDANNISNPACYTSNPPTSGPHSSSPQGFGNMTNPAPKENVLHSMEHGGVYIWYNTADQQAVDLIKSLVDDNTDRRRFVGSTIYPGMESETIAITSWTRLDKFPVSELTKDRLQKFVDEHHKRFNPEGF